MIDSDAVLAIGTAVTLMTGITKTLLPDGKANDLAPYVALAISLLATVAFVVSMPVLPGRTDLFGLLVAWLTIWGTATGVYHGAKLASAAVSS